MTNADRNTNFSLSNYDIIGFDLDNTLVRYKIPQLFALVYDCLAKFLINERGYDSQFLKQSIDGKRSFAQKGLFLDTEKGNLLQIAGDGKILKAAHGTNFLSSPQIEQIYGVERKSEIISLFIQDPLSTWNGPLSGKIRTLLDCFDVPVALLFARAVDSLDVDPIKKPAKYNVWQDLLDGLNLLYSRKNFDQHSEYFEALKNNPEKFLVRAKPETIEWLKELKSKKLSYLLTGSHIDYAELIAQYVFGPNWKDLFHITICFARKPGFFIKENQFYKVVDYKEVHTVTNVNDMKIGQVYSQGTWKMLQNVLAKSKNIFNPKCLYIGDNVIQDVYTPSKYDHCDTIATIEDMNELSSLGADSWLPYFGSKETPTVWMHLVQKHSKICVSSVDVLVRQSLDHEYEIFGGTVGSGFYDE